MMQIKYTSFSTAMKDLVNPKMILISLMPLFIYIILAILIIIYAYNNFHALLYYFPNIWVDFANEDGFLNTISFVILCLFAWVVIFFLIFLLSNIFIMIFFLFAVPFIVSYLHKKYYSSITLNPESLTNSTFLSMKILFQTLIRLALFAIVSYLLVFIGLGFISFFIMLYACYNFYSKNITYQVASLVMKNNEFQLFMRFNKFHLAFINIIGYFISTIPFFGQLFFTSSIISLSHFILSWYKDNEDKINDLYIQDAKIYDK